VKIELQGFGRHVDGEYEFPANLTRREWRTMKRVSQGVRPLELEAALAALDQDVLIAFAMIAMERAGKPQHENVFLDASGDAVIRILDEDAEKEDEDRPPASATATGPESKPAVERSEPEKPVASGPGTSDDSDTPETTLRAVGGLS
jgi:hypothetical protein